MCFFISKTYDKVYHINNCNTDEKICDIRLIATHRMVGGSTMNVKVNRSIAIMEGKKSTNCCCQQIHTIKNNMPITIKFESIPQLFEQHTIQFVLDMAPIWDKPLSRLHLYINNKNVMDTTRSINEYTETAYITSKLFIWWSLMFIMSIIFTVIYATIFYLFIGEYTWIAIEAYIVFGALTWMTIWSGISKSLCGCCNDTTPAHINISFDPNTGNVGQKQTMKATQTSQTDKELVVCVHDKLPYGWTKLFTDEGKVYYQNRMTKQTQWNQPINESKQIQWERPIVSNEAVEIVQH